MGKHCSEFRGTEFRVQRYSEMITDCPLMEKVHIFCTDHNNGNPQKKKKTLEKGEECIGFASELVLKGFKSRRKILPFHCCSLREPLQLMAI